MPTYEYRCDTCGEHHEVVQSFRDEPLTECPACGGHLRKVFGNIGVVFKGSGFYKTDSRKPSPAGKGSAKDKEPAKTGDSKSSTESSSGSKESSASGEKPTTSTTSTSSSGSGTSGGSAAAAAS